MKNLLLMQVTAVMPHVDLSGIDSSMESLRNTANALPEGPTRVEMQATVTRLWAQREAVRQSADRDMIHVSFIDDDSGGHSVGVANFLVPSGEYEEGKTYRITTEEVS